MKLDIYLSPETQRPFAVNNLVDREIKKWIELLVFAPRDD